MADEKDYDVAGLSEEEIAALEDEDGADGDADESAVDKQSAGDDQPADAAASDTAEPEEVEAEVEPAQEAQSEGEVEVEVAQQPFVPSYHIEAPTDLGERITETEAAQNENARKFESGDIDFEAYRANDQKYQAELRVMGEQRLRSEFAAELTRQSGVQKWGWDQDQFLSAPVNKLYENKILYSALDTSVKEIARDPEWRGKSGAQVLAEADRRVREVFKLGHQEAPAQKAEVSGKKVITRAAKPVIPQTLSNIPAAGDSDKDEFSHLDDLGGMELESALAAMNPAQQDRYLRGTH